MPRPAMSSLPISRPGTVCEFERGGHAPGADGGGAATERRALADHPAAWPDFRWIVLQRHGRRPQAILGRTLLHGDNRCRGQPWWSSITIHETSTSRFVVALCHMAPEDAGPAWRDAWVSGSAAELRDTLARHDPLEALPLGRASGMRPTLPAPFGIGGLRDAELAWHFRAAWAGLLGALLGLRPVGTNVVPAA